MHSAVTFLIRHRPGVDNIFHDKIHAISTSFRFFQNFNFSVSKVFNFFNLVIENFHFVFTKSFRCNEFPVFGLEKIGESSIVVHRKRTIFLIFTNIFDSNIHGFR
jgi:hypothetical protein